MTEQEALALEPRELDALVAEKVMGWERKSIRVGTKDPNFRATEQRNSCVSGRLAFNGPNQPQFAWRHGRQFHIPGLAHQPSTQQRTGNRRPFAHCLGPFPSA